MEKLIYLDNNATTFVLNEVRDEILIHLKELYGNPSSIYSKGREAKKSLEEARESVALFFNSAPDEVVFTSCGSESNNLAIKGTFFSSLKKKRHVISCKTEHPSVINTLESLKEFGATITYLDVDRSGHIDMNELRDNITDDTILISLMLANNETGVIHDLKNVSEIARETGILLHTDAVQASGKIPIDVKKLGVDILSISGHKFHAPKGIGALYVKKGIILKPQIDGGGQEFGLRSGTENTSYIAGLKKACEIARDGIGRISPYMRSLKDAFYEKLKSDINDLAYNGDYERSLPNTLSLSFPGVDIQSLLISLDLKGIMVSSGSACSSGASKSSRIIAAMGIDDELSRSVLRVSFSAYNTMEEVLKAADIIIDTVNSLKKC